MASTEPVRPLTAEIGLAARRAAEKRGPMFLPQSIRARLAGGLLAAVALMGVTGCTATVTARPARTAVLYDYPVVYVDDAPRVVDSPVVFYHGRPAYLVGSRWYYESNAGWLYFRDEPRELRRARTTRSYVRVQADTPRRSYEERRPERRRYVEQPTETRRRRYD